MTRIVVLLVGVLLSAWALAGSTVDVNPFSGGGGSGINNVTGTAPISVTVNGSSVAAVSLTTPLASNYGGTGASSAAVYPLSGNVATYPVPAASIAATLAVNIGGTGITTATAGSPILGGGGSSALVVATAGATNAVLIEGAAGASFGAVQLASPAAVTGILPITNGGTNSSTTLSNNRIMVSSGGAVIEGATPASIASVIVAASPGGVTTSANLIYDGSGNLAVGTTTPTNRLSIYSVDHTKNAFGIVFDQVIDPFTIKNTGGATLLDVDVNGDVYMTRLFASNTGSQTSPSWAFNDGLLRSGCWEASSDIIACGTHQQEIFRITDRKSGSFPGNFQFDSHTKSTQTTGPTATPTAAAGTGATCSVSNATDMAGKISLTTTGVASSSGDVCDVTFNQAYGVAPICVFTPVSANAIVDAVIQGVYFTTVTTSAAVTFANTDTIGRSYSWSYYCIETQ